MHVSVAKTSMTGGSVLVPLFLFVVLALRNRNGVKRRTLRIDLGHGMMEGIRSGEL